RGNDVTLGRENGVADHALMTVQDMQWLTAGDIPDDGGVVVSGGNEPFPIRREGNTQNAIGMSFKGANGLPRCSIPQPNFFIATAACDHCAIWRENGVTHVFGMTR